jgi:cobalt-zinc-cadmium efflux system membrane fusion protein
MSQTTLTHGESLVQPAAKSAGGAAKSLPRAGRFWRWLAAAMPTAIVMAALGGIAYWGHTNHWTLPAFSSIVGEQASDEALWCPEHNVAELACIECNTDLVPAVENYGWCQEHGVAQCPLHHPEIAQLRSPPTISEADLEQAAHALAIRPRVENNGVCQTHTKRIQFASLVSMEKAGVDIAIVKQRPIVEAIVANGEVVYDETVTAHLASRVAGTVWRVEKQVGEWVAKGEVLALVDAAEVGRAKAEFLQAISALRLAKINVDRLAPLAESGSVAGRHIRESESAHQEAQIRLLGAQQRLVNLGLRVRADDFAELGTEEIAERIQFLGLPADLVAELDPESATSNLLPLRAPLESVVVARSVVPGEMVDTGTTIFKLSDMRQLWLTLDVRQDDAKYLELGQTVRFRASEAERAAEVEGSLAWIATEADDVTRTVKVRVNLPNLEGRLRANTFGRGRIVLREESQAVVVPSEAVHWDGCCHVVFVRDLGFLQPDAAKFFHVRKVRPGVEQDDMTEIIVGLLPGEIIASTNSVVLESQLLKSNLGAGCCGHSHAH